MSQILNKIQGVDPNNSEAIKEALSPFFQSLSKHKEEDCIQWLRVLESVINRFPKYCMSQRGTIETYLSHFLDSTNFYIVIEAAKCACVLQQVRPTQEKTATPKSNWRDQMSALCNAAHLLIGELFPNAVDIFQTAARIQTEQQETNSPLAIALATLSMSTTNTQNNVLTKETLLSTRLRNVFIFLQAMLVEVYPVAKPIRPQDLVEVIVRALSVTSGTNHLQSLSDVAMVKIEAFRTVDAVVACMGPNLIPFSPLILKFVIQSLKWSSDSSSEQIRKVRISTYGTLTSWLDTLQTHTTAQERGQWEDELTNQIIKDITPPKHVVELKMSSQPTKHLSKKAKKKLTNNMLQDSSLSSHMPGERNKVAIFEELNDDVAIAALECAEAFLTVCGLFLQPNTHKRFQERLVRECFTLESYSSSRVLGLLRCLEASRKAAPPTVPPPTQYCLQLYSVMSNSHQREISKFCSQALLDIRMHLHCSPPSLHFAIEVQPEKDQEKLDQKKKISEKNRAALTALLGEDKVPKESEEIITIIDEPSSKRRRLDDSKGSVVEPVQISDDSDDGIEQLNIKDTVIVDETTMSEEEDHDTDVHGKETQLLNTNIDEIDNNTDAIQLSNKNNRQIEEDENSIDMQMEQYAILISEDKVDSTQTEMLAIHEETTQLPINIPTEDEETPLSLEVAYDLVNTGNGKVTKLDKLEGDNLPSSNETDDIQITCGQTVKDSQDAELEKKDSKTNIIEIKVNGVERSPEKPLQNGDISESSVTANVSKEVTVADMLADFVDEVNEDTQASIPA